MISTLLRVGWISLKRDRAALFLTFALPIVFFSIFAMVLSNAGGGSMESVDLRVLLVDLDDSEVSRDLAASLGAQEAITMVEVDPSGEPWGRDGAFDTVRQGEADAAIVLPVGLSDGFGQFTGEPPTVELIYDAANPMAQFTVSGLLQAASFQSSPGVLMEGGMGMLEQFGGGLTPEQEKAMALARSFMDSGEVPGGGEIPGLISVDATAAQEDGDDDDGPEMIAYYAAGIGVMFLLFSMTGAAGGLLEEEERGTLERLLISNVTMSALLGSRWMFFTVLGLVQVLLMFVWGWAVFGLDLWTPERVAGVLAVGAATAAAAASFGLVLAAACRSRAQLGGLSTIVVLVMSALGGSMMPRFIMPDFMQTVSRFTLNGWALDGFLDVFWYADPDTGLAGMLSSIALEVAVLSTLAVVLFVVARRLARRWEVV